jgi:hypothetical protein
MKCLNAKERQRDNRVFSVVSVVWQLPLIHVVALKSPRRELRPPLKSPRRGRSLGVSVHHLRHGGAQTMYKVTKTSFGLSQLLGKLRRSPRSSRSPRCCQPPRVTSLDLHLSRIQTPSMDAPSYLLNLLCSPLDLDALAWSQVHKLRFSGSQLNRMCILHLDWRALSNGRDRGGLYRQQTKYSRWRKSCQNSQTSLVNPMPPFP